MIRSAAWFALPLGILGCQASPEPGVPTPVPILPADPVQGRDALTCGVPPGIPVTWEVDGAAYPHASATLPAEATRAGRRWTCAAREADRALQGATEVRPLGGNVLLFLLDDVGVDRIGAYEAHPNPAHTPVIDGLAAIGVRFERAWAAPVCSPSRAALMTGRMPGRYGIGHIIDEHAPDHILPAEEVYLPELLATAPTPYTSALVGKWHLSGKTAEQADHPSRAAGFAWHSGPLENLPVAATDILPPRNYFRWEENVNGALGLRVGYATAHQVNSAIGQIRELPEPWFVYVAFSGAHAPLHTPPANAGYSPPADDSESEKHRSMVESMDRAIGAVLAALPEEQQARTTVFVLGDNGTRPDLPVPPLAAGKGTVFEAGVRVPFVVAGQAVRSPGVSPALVHLTDVYDTLAALSGADPDRVDPATADHPRDSVSFLPSLADPAAPGARSVLTTEWFVPNGPPPYDSVQLAATDGRFKLLTAWGPDVEAPLTRLVDLRLDPGELHDLLDAPLSPEAEGARATLERALTERSATYDLPWVTP